MNKNGEKKQYKLVPPDGGWAYVICVAGYIMMAPTSGFVPSFGLMYNDLMVEIGMGTTLMGLVVGCNAMCLAISAYLTSPLLKIFSVRQFALIAAALFNIGAFGVAFANSTTTFIISLSLLKYTGFGIIYNLVFTSVKNYFHKRRFFAVGVIQTGNAISGLCVPMIIKLATDYYGHRGMLIIIASFGLHVFIGASLLQPVEWHMKKEEIENKNDTELKTPLMDNKDTNSDKTTVSISRDIESVSHNNNHKELDDFIPKSKKPSAMKKVFNNMIDVKLFKEFLFSTACLLLGFAVFADYMYSVMIPRALYAEGKNRKYVAWAVSMIAFGDLATRITFIFFNAWMMKIGSKQLHLLGTVVAVLARIGMMCINDSIALLVFLAISGIGRCMVTILIPIVIADSVSPDKYTGALGISLIFMGILNLTLGPLLGAIRDITGSYELVFYICTAILLGVSLVWVYDLKIKKQTKKDNNKEPEKIGEKAENIDS